MSNQTKNNFLLINWDSWEDYVLLDGWYLFILNYELVFNISSTFGRKYIYIYIYIWMARQYPVRPNPRKLYEMYVLVCWFVIAKKLHRFLANNFQDTINHQTRRNHEETNIWHPSYKKNNIVWIKKYWKIWI